MRVMLFFITPKDSDTGKKLAEIDRKMNACNDEQKKMLEKHGFQKLYPKPFVAWGGIDSFVSFIGGTPDPSVWRKTAQGYVPLRSSPGGKAIAAELQEMSVVMIHELNFCVNVREKLNSIGFYRRHTTHYGFTVISDWRFDKPADCTEVIGSDFLEMFEEAV